MSDSPARNEMSETVTWKQCWERKCCRFFRKQFHYSKFWLFHYNWKAFTYSPLLRYNKRCQAIYLAYRWFLAVYFFCWIIASWATATNMYFTFLTNWSFIVYNAYLVVAAISTTTSYLSAHFVCPRDDQDFTREDEMDLKKPTGCCGYKDNKIKWYQMVHWVLFTVGVETAIVVVVLFWSLLRNDNSAISMHVHLMNGIIAIVDFWVSGIPFNLLHFIYPVSFGALYVIFTGIYFAASQEIIYDALNYNNTDSIGAVVGVCMGSLSFIFLLHVFFFFMYMIKVGIFNYLVGKMKNKILPQPLADNSDEENLPPEEENVHPDSGPDDRGILQVTSEV